MTTVFRTPRDGARATGTWWMRAARRSAASPRSWPCACAASTSPNTRPHVDTGDHIIVFNAEKIRVTGDKLEDKIYYWHTGAIGGIKSRSLEKMLSEHPERVIEFAVKGMLPEEPARPRRCSRSCTCSRATSTRTPPSSRSRSNSEAHGTMTDSCPPIPNYGTGRRKTSTARVHMRPGTGKITHQRPHHRRVLRSRDLAHDRAPAARDRAGRRPVRHRRERATAAASPARPAPSVTASRAR